MRPRFSLRLLLVAVTIAAIGFGVSRLYIGPRKITEANFGTVKVGQTELQVRLSLGPPRYVYSGQRINWRYFFQDNKYEYGSIDFVDGRVVEVNKESVFTFNSFPSKARY